MKGPGFVADTTEEANRTDWYLREHGRFPSVEELRAIRDYRATEAADRRSFREKLERSSLGTPAARALRQSVSDDVAARVVARSHELSSARHGSR